MMLRAFALLSVTLAGFALAPRTPAPGSPLDTDSRVMQVASTDLKHQSLTHVLRWLGRQTSVRSVSLGPDGRTVDVRFRDGRHIAILPASLGSVRLPRSFRPEVNPRSRSMAPGPGRALVLEPFATELGLGPNAGDVEVADLHAAGFAVDQLYNTSVDVNSMKLLSQYNLVYMHTHSGFITGGFGLIATGQPFNNDPSMSPLIQNGSVVEAFVSGTTQHYYAITATYLTNYEGQFARDSLVFFNGCNVLNAPDVWQAMKAKGLGVLVSWDAEATSLDNYFAGVAFFGGMRVQGVTVAQSIQQAQAAGYGKSTNNGQTARLGYLGDGTITLQRAAAGQLAITPVPIGTAPPAPTAAPTARPVNTAVPTSTPAPTTTPTPRPGPSLIVSFNQRVAPGARQVVTVRSTPNTPIQVRVDYPTGASQSWTATTDASGISRYVYVQPASMVTYQHVFATLTIQAGNGAVSTVKERYRIGWGKIDVSTVPHEQAVGQVVSIWVHAAARARVTVFLHFPSGSSKRLVGMTLARGWAHFHYTIQRSLKKGSNRTVQVQARTRRGQTVFKAQTTFLIK